MAVVPGTLQAGRPTASTVESGTGIVYAAWRSRVLLGLTIATAIGLVIMLVMALFVAQPDATQGDAQRIFYIHVSSYAGSAVAFFCTVVGGLAYLITRQKKWDQLALSGVEIGLSLATITLITGMCWARPIWNTWWADDPRLNAMAVMWLIYAAYLTLRSALEDPDRRARYAAVYGIAAFASVVFVYMIPRVRTDTLHPVVLTAGPTENKKGQFGVEDPSMISTLSIAMIWWTMAAVTLVWYRVRVENLADRVRTIKARLLEAAGE